VRECNNCGPVPITGWFRVPRRGLRCRVCAWESFQRWRDGGAIPDERVCKDCGETKAASEYHRVSGSATRLRARCKPCFRAKVNARRQRSSRDQ